MNPRHLVLETNVLPTELRTLTQKRFLRLNRNLFSHVVTIIIINEKSTVNPNKTACFFIIKLSDFLPKLKHVEIALTIELN